MMAVSDDNASTNPQLGNTMFGGFTLEIIWRTAVFSLREKYLLECILEE
jgi:hypothetical protein